MLKIETILSKSLIVSFIYNYSSHGVNFGGVQKVQGLNPGKAALFSIGWASVIVM